MKQFSCFLLTEKKKKEIGFHVCFILCVISFLEGILLENKKTNTGKQIS